MAHAEIYHHGGIILSVECISENTYIAWLLLHNNYVF